MSPHVKAHFAKHGDVKEPVSVPGIAQTVGRFKLNGTAVQIVQSVVLFSTDLGACVLITASRERCARGRGAVFQAISSRKVVLGTGKVAAFDPLQRTQVENAVDIALILAVGDGSDPTARQIQNADQIAHALRRRHPDDRYVVPDRQVAAVADRRGVILLGARSSKRVRRDGARANDRQRTGVVQGGCAAVRGEHFCRAGDVFKGAAVQLDGHGPLVDDAAQAPEAVQVERQGRSGARGDQQRGRILLDKGAAVGKQGDRRGRAVRDEAHGAREGLIVFPGEAVVGHVAGIEAVDVDRAAVRLSDRDDAQVAVAAVPGAGHVPEAVGQGGVRAVHAHARVRRRGIGRADRKRLLRPGHDVQRRAVNGHDVGDRIARIVLVDPVLRLVQDEGGDAAGRRAGQGHRGVRRDARHGDRAVADRSGAGGGRRGQARQPARVIGRRVGVIVVEALGDGVAVQLEIHLEPVPPQIVRVVFEGPAALRGGGVHVAAVAVLELRGADADRAIRKLSCPVDLLLPFDLDRGAVRRGRVIDDSARALR